MPITPSRRFSRKAFTLIELLIVIGIIAILVGILLPLYSKVRLAAYNADTQAEISTLSSAIIQYHTDFNAYPGPLSNDQIEQQASIPLGITSPGGTPTYSGIVSMSQNLTLGLLGGLTIYNSANSVTGQIYFDQTAVGSGPLVLNSLNPRRHPPYINNFQGLLSNGQFSDAAGNYAGDFGNKTPNPAAANQTPGIPVFTDRYPGNSLPILYLRARVGAPGVITNLQNPQKLQYDLQQILVYTSAAIGSPSYNGLKQHGLAGVEGNFTTAPFTGTVSADFPANAGAYFFNPNATVIGLNPELGGRPRVVDEFILISAGADGTYGTPDDITSFGDVVPQ